MSSIRSRMSAFTVATCLTLAIRPAVGQSDSLGLPEALAIARSRSPVLAAADAATRGAAGRMAVARSARWPRLNAEAIYLRFEDPPAATLGPLGRLSPIPLTGYFLQLGVQQPVYTSGRITAAVRAAEWAERSASLTRAQAEVELTAAVAHAHDAVLLARALQGVAAEAVAVLDSAVTVAQANYEAGAVARLDVLRAETRRASAQVDLRSATTALTGTEERLAVLLGLDPAAPRVVVGSLDPPAEPLDSVTLTHFVRRARGERPDLVALDAASQAATHRADAARAATRPSVALYAASLTTRPELVTGRERWASQLYGGVLASWPLLDFGAAAGDADIARAEGERARAEASRLGDEAVAAVRASARDYARATVDIAAGRENVTRAARALAIARDRYAEGAGIQLEVLEAQADLVKARADLLRAIHTQRSAAVELRRAAGIVADAPLLTDTSLGKEGR